MRLHMHRSRARLLVTLATCLLAGGVVPAVVLGGTPADAQQPPVPYAGSYATAVSCASSSLCMLGYVSGDWSEWDGSSWSAPQVFPGAGLADVSDISCPSEQFCAAVDGGLSAWDGSTWSIPIDWSGPTFGPVVISCTSSTFCMGLSDDGQYFLGSGDIASSAGWSGPGLIPGFPDSTLLNMGGLSCSQESGGDFCMFVSPTGVAASFTYSAAAGSGTWSAPMSFGVADSNDSLGLSVSCATSSLCMGVDGYGDLFEYDGSAWSPETIVDQVGYEPPIGRVWCTSDTSCVAALSGGYEELYRWNGTSWIGPTFLGQGGPGPTDMSCAPTGAGYCSLLDQDGDYFVDPTPLSLPGGSTLPSGTAGSGYSDELYPIGGSGPYTCQVASGSLGDLSLATTVGTGDLDLCYIFGTPEYGGQRDFTLQVTDAAGDTYSQPYSIDISGPPPTTTVPDPTTTVPAATTTVPPPTTTVPAPTTTTPAPTTTSQPASSTTEPSGSPAVPPATPAAASSATSTVAPTTSSTILPAAPARLALTSATVLSQGNRILVSARCVATSACRGVATLVSPPARGSRVARTSQSTDVLASGRLAVAADRKVTVRLVVRPTGKRELSDLNSAGRRAVLRISLVAGTSTVTDVVIRPDREQRQGTQKT